jgi:signal transduction histidine kinase
MDAEARAGPESPDRDSVRALAAATESRDGMGRIIRADRVQRPTRACTKLGGDRRFLAFVMLSVPFGVTGLASIGQLAYLLATCATGIAVVARTWFPGSASLAVAYFWPINLLMQSLMLVAVLTVSGRLLAEVPEQARRLEGARQARLRLAALARKFRGLLKVVSHEIRNPASSVRFVATNLRRGMLSPEDAAADLIRISKRIVRSVSSAKLRRSCSGSPCSTTARSALMRRRSTTARRARLQPDRRRVVSAPCQP